MIWHHHLDPYLLGPWTISGQQVGVRYYSLPYILTFLAIYYVLSRSAKRREIPNANSGLIEDAAILLLVSVMVGGRLGFFLLNQPTRLLSAAGWLEVLQIWHGGMAFFGAVVAAYVVEQWYCRRHKIGFWHATDRVMWILAFGLGFGRLTNYINAELIGVPTNGSFGVIYDSLPPDLWINGLNPPRHPVQLYAALSHFLLGFFLLYLVRRQPRTAFDRVPGFTCFWFLGGYGLLRFITDFWRAETIWVVPGVLNGGQALSLILALVALLGARLRLAALREHGGECDWYPPEGISGKLPDTCFRYLDSQQSEPRQEAPKPGPAKPRRKR